MRIGTISRGLILASLTLVAFSVSQFESAAASRDAEGSSARPDPSEGRVVLRTHNVEIRADEHGVLTRRFGSFATTESSQGAELPQGLSTIGSTAVPSPSSWRALKLYGGSLTCMDISPVDPDLVLIGVEDGDVSGSFFESKDGGVSWSRVDLSSTNPPYYYKGSVYDVEFLADGTAFVTTSNNVLRRATDGSWSVINANGFRYHVFTEIGVSPGNPLEIWLGGYFALGSATPVMMRSLDGGATWTNVAPPLGQYMMCRGIAFNSYDPRIVVAAYGYDSGALWRTLDSGASWTRVKTLSNSEFSDVVFDGTQFLASAERYTQGGVYASWTGLSWSRMDNGYWPSNQVYDLDVDPSQPGVCLASTSSGLTRYKDGYWSHHVGGTLKYGIAARMCPGDPDRILVGQEPDGVLRSTDGGASFAVSSEGLLALNVSDAVANPTNPQEIVASFRALNSGGLYKSLDGGETWTRDPYFMVRMGDLEFAPDGTLYACAEGMSRTRPEGIYRRNPNGSWTPLGPFGDPDLFDDTIACIRVDRHHPDTVFISGWHYPEYTAGIWRSTNRGTNWTRVFTGPPAVSVIDAVHEIQFVEDGTGQTLLAVLNRDGLLRSTDGGDTWAAKPGIPEMGGRPYLRGTPADPSLFYVTSYFSPKVYRSHDGGQTWAPFPTVGFSPFAVDRVHPDVVYGNVYGQFTVGRSQDGGSTFDPFNEGCPITFGSDLSWIDGPCPTLLYATTTGVYVREIDTVAPEISLELEPNVLWPPDHKLRTITARIHTSDTCDANPSFALTSVTVEDETGAPQDVVANIGAGTTTFQLRAERSGKGGRRYLVTYTAKDASGNTREATAVVRVPHDQSGIELADNPAAHGSTPKKTELVSVDPNPFNPSTAAMITLASEQRVSLDVYDVRGARVRSLQAGVLPAGAHRIAWDGSDEQGRPAASGVYFFRFVAGNRVQTLKALLIK